MVLKGSMSMEQRDRMISAFTEDPDVTVFLMSLKAGGSPSPMLLSSAQITLLRHARYPRENTFRPQL